MTEATHSTDWPAVRAAIADAMAARGMSSQRALAEQAGVDQATLSRFLAGKQALAFDTARRIAGALALDPATLLGLAPPAAPHPEEARSAVSKGEGPLRMIPLNEIAPSRFNPRTVFEEGRLADLADSIERHGLEVPLLVAPGALGAVMENCSGASWVLIDGERRWHACRLLVQSGRMEPDAPVPCMLHDPVDHEEHFTMSLVTSVQRENLTPLEEAAACGRLATDWGWPTARIADSVGRTQRWVEQRLTLLRLGIPARIALEDGIIGPAQARHIARIEDKSLQQALVDHIRGGALPATEDAVRTRVGQLLSKPAHERPRILEDRPDRMRRGPEPDEDEGDHDESPSLRGGAAAAAIQDEDDNPPVTDEPQDERRSPAPTDESGWDPFRAMMACHSETFSLQSRDGAECGIWIHEVAPGRYGWRARVWCDQFAFAEEPSPDAMEVDAKGSVGEAVTAAAHWMAGEAAARLRGEQGPVTSPEALYLSILLDTANGVIEERGGATVEAAPRTPPIEDGFTPATWSGPLDEGFPETLVVERANGRTRTYRRASKEPGDG